MRKLGIFALAFAGTAALIAGALAFVGIWRHCEADIGFVRLFSGLGIFDIHVDTVEFEWRPARLELFFEPMRPEIPLIWAPEYELSKASDWPIWCIIPWWLLLLFALTCFGAVIFLHRRRRPRAGACESCGYLLVRNVSGRCPECGEPCVPGSSKPGVGSRSGS